MQKYQYYISFNDKRNTAASKAIQDCRSILANLGYEDVTIESELTTSKSYLMGVLVKTLKFFLKIKAGSIVAVQYPLLSGNPQFKYFIKAGRLKNVKFFCIIHDIEELRYGKGDKLKESKEVKILNNYDCVIVHNDVMQNWLESKGLNVPTINLKIFDYLTIKNTPVKSMSLQSDFKTVVFAGNLSKSEFIYTLNKVPNWHFNLYGPNFTEQKGETLNNVNWLGSLGPDEIVRELNGDFGLIWDGDNVDGLSGDHGNYLKYNNPHKLSLYLAAGLPVIAPKGSAISRFVKKYNIGLLIDSLTDLNSIEVDDALYRMFKKNAVAMSNNIRSGYYMETAVKAAEKEIAAVRQISGAMVKPS